MRVEKADVPIERLVEGETFREIHELWQRLCGDRFAPPWRAVDMLELPGTVLPFLTVVDVRDAPADFVYRLWGTGHTTVKGIDLTGHSVLRHGTPTLGEVVFEEMREVAAARRPLGFRHDVLPQPDRFSLYQDTLRLPMSADGERVTQILSFADWKSRGSEWQRLFEYERQVR